MRRKEIERRIKRTYQSSIDSFKVDIDLKDYNINLHNETYKNSTFKKRFVFRTAFLAVLLVISFFAFRSIINNTQPVLAKTSDIVAFQAVSSTDLLVQTAINQTTTLSFNSNTSNAMTLGVTPISEVENELDMLNKYMNMIEQFIATQSELNVQVVESDNPDYQNKLIYQGFDLSGKAIEYNFYYNETSITADSNKTFMFNDENSDKTTMLLEGTMTVLNKTYLLEGKQIDINNETIYSLYSYIDKQNYVYVRYEPDTTDGKKKFFYTVVNDGVVQNQSKISVATENDKLVTNLEFQDNGLTGQYQIIRGDNGNSSTVNINYSIQKGDQETETGTISVQIVTDETTQNTSYVYVVKPSNSESEQTYEGDRKDSFGEHDDDENESHEDNEDNENQGTTTTTEDGSSTTENPDSGENEVEIED